MFRFCFLDSSVCIVAGFAGEIHFPRTPISYSVPGFHFPWVAPFPPAAEDFVLLTCPPAAANSSPPASRAAAEGLRSAAFTFVASAPRCPLRLPPNRAVRSHPLRGAYRAFFAGRQCCFVSHTRYYAELRLCCDIFIGTSIRVKRKRFMRKPPWGWCGPERRDGASELCLRGSASRAAGRRRRRVRSGRP